MAVTVDTTNTSFPRRRKQSVVRWLPLLVAAAIVMPLANFAIRPLFAQLQYQPEQGDIVFQSLPRGRLVNAIEGATASPYSHCGIIAEENGEWVVLEAFDGVSATPLRTWLRRGRGGSFAVYRLKEDLRPNIPSTLAAARKHLGRKYDTRYRLGGDEVYCSELIYLAYQSATGDSLGQTVRLEQLNWKPFQTLIEEMEGGPPPLDREIITPADLARAPQLELVYEFGYR